MVLGPESVPRAGFGMGIERGVVWICSIARVRLPSQALSTVSLSPAHFASPFFSQIRVNFLAEDAANVLVCQW